MKEFLDQIYSKKNVLPARENVLKALCLCKPEQVKVVILGQDPYPNAKDAMGLSFSVPHNKIPASLRNIFKELSSDLKIPIPKTGDLTKWAQNGVLLLNSILTVEEGKPLSHKGIGWEERTTRFLQKVANTGNPVVILAWGRYAQERLTYVRMHDKRLIITGGHPSPLNKSKSSPFLGGRYFTNANVWLQKHGVTPVDWSLDESEDYTEDQDG